MFRNVQIYNFDKNILSGDYGDSDVLMSVFFADLGREYIWIMNGDHIYY